MDLVDAHLVDAHGDCLDYACLRQGGIRLLKTILAAFDVHLPGLHSIEGI